ncbi:MAG: hypothetical protein INR73_13530 [Williamsia sp.]|nr:hypothetical protein [Williamsia sp.]
MKPPYIINETLELERAFQKLRNELARTSDMLVYDHYLDARGKAEISKKPRRRTHAKLVDHSIY